MNLVLPTPEQAAWADCELGVIIHFDLTTFAEKEWRFGDHWGEPLPPSLFDPQNLDTDQWLQAAADMGARYAVLVAKHCTGFCLWPTKAHGYSVASSPWKGGKGDLVADFTASCKKYGIKPGLYYSSSCNHYLNAEGGRVRSGDPEEQKQYNAVVLQQLTELWSNYGELFEIWFDGGCLPVEKGGPDITPLLHRLQPGANVFQGPEGTRSLLRWVGNERAFAPENCSSIFRFYSQDEDGTVERLDCGDTRGDTWCPAESDRPNREAPSLQGGWFWQEDEEQYIVPAAELFEMYLHSVGRNTNMLLGMAIDQAGLVPEPDELEFRRFGKLVQEAFAAPLCRAEIRPGDTALSLRVPPGQRAAYLVIGEDVTKGERVTGFSVQADGEKIYDGEIIGHKRILRLDAAEEVRVTITASKAETALRFAELY